MLEQLFAEMDDRVRMARLRAIRNAELLGVYLFRPTSRKQKIPFIMFGLQRSGTTVLGDLLARHPDVTWLGEAYEQLAYFPVLYLNAVAHSSSTTSIGLKAFSFHLCKVIEMSDRSYPQSEIDRGRRILEKLRAKEWKFLHLTRTDMFGQAVSLTRALRTGVWHQTGTRNESDCRLRFDPLEFKQHLGFLLKCSRYEREVFPGFEMLQLNYEADILNPENHQAVAEKVFTHLGLPAISVSSNMKKLAGERLDAQIENYEELVRAAESLGVIPGQQALHVA